MEKTGDEKSCVNIMKSTTWILQLDFSHSIFEAGPGNLHILLEDHCWEIYLVYHSSNKDNVESKGAETKTGEIDTK
jgi:hypothetical protein